MSKIDKAREAVLPDDRDLIRNYLNQNPIKNGQWQYSFKGSVGFSFNGNVLYSHGLVLAVLLWSGNSKKRADFAIVNYETVQPENRIHRKLLFEVLKEEDMQFLTNQFCNGEDSDDDLVVIDGKSKKEDRAGTE